jgi:hypothetical protein
MLSSRVDEMRQASLMHTFTDRDAVKHLTMRTSEWSTGISEDQETARQIAQYATKYKSLRPYQPVTTQFINSCQ